MLTIREVIKKGLPVHVFPKEIRDFVTGFAKGSGCQESFVVSGVLACAAGVCSQHSIIIKNGYKERSNFFLCLVGKPGVTKSAPIKAALKPLLAIEARNNDKYKKEFNAWKELLKNGGLKKNERDALAMQQPAREPCHVITDGSIEAMFQHLEAMSDAGKNPHCVYVKDELKGFFGGMDKYKSKGGDEYETWLSLFSGADLVKTLVSRTLFVKGARTTVIGGIQPDVYNACMKDKGDGMTDRFMITIFEGDPILTDIHKFCELNVLKDYNDFMEEIGEVKGKTYDLWAGSHRDLVLNRVQEFHIWTHNLGIIYETGAFKKWEQCFYRICLIIAAIWKKTEIDLDVINKSIDLASYYASDWLKAKIMSEKSVNDIYAEKVKKALKKSDLSRRDIQRQIHKTKAETCDIIREMMDDGDIIRVDDKSSSNENTFLYSLKEGDLTNV